MDDLSKRLEALLQSPDSLAKLQGALAALGGESPSPAASPASSPPPAPPSHAAYNATGTPPAAASLAGNAPDLSALAGLLPLLNNLGKDQAASSPAPAAPAGGLDASALLQLLPLLSGASGGADETGGSSGSSKADPTALLQLLPLLSGLGGGKTGGAPDLGGLTRLLPLLSGRGREDENTALLRALRPYLHGEREKRLDGAIKLLQMSQVLPLLK